MTAEALGSETRGRSNQHLDYLVKHVAEWFSELRRIRKLLWEHEQRLGSLHEVHSSDHEMRGDWKNACAFVALKVIEGAELDLTQLDPSSYRILEEVWLKRVKQLKAYYIWERSDQGGNEANYHLASQIIRQLFLERPRSSRQDFEPVRQYIQERYLKNGSSAVLDDDKPAAMMMITAKAERIHRSTGEYNPDTNWLRARLYASLFYENIIGAVDRDDRSKIISILKAFQFSKSPRNKYWIINAFEAAIAIQFLNKEILKELFDRFEMYNFSMEPVEAWPGGMRDSDSLFYDAGQKQLIYLGQMSDERKQEILLPLTRSDHRQAVENLYEQSRVGPLEETIL
jgi:hypothetical protein